LTFSVFQRISSLLDFTTFSFFFLPIFVSFFNLASSDRFLIGFRSTVANRSRLLQKTKFEWKAEMDYNKLKELNQTAPILHVPDSTKPFWLNADASAFEIRAILLQKDDDVLRPLAFYSTKLKGADITLSNT